MIIFYLGSCLSTCCYFLCFCFLECEKVRRRQLRIVQVRNQTNEFSKRVRAKVKEEQEAQMLKLAEQELAKYKRQKEDELARLEQEYQNALADIGMGHEGIQEQEEYVKYKTKY